MLVFLLFLLSSNLVSSFNPHSLTNPLKHVVKRYDWSFTKTINGVQRTCEWFGTAPYCNGECPENYEEIDRKGRKIKDDCKYAATNEHRCHLDPLFGYPCDLWLTKALCCLKI